MLQQSQRKKKKSVAHFHGVKDEKPSKRLQLHIRGRLFLFFCGMFSFFYFFFPYYLLLVITVTERGRLERQHTLRERKK